MTGMDYPGDYPMLDVIQNVFSVPQFYIQLINRYATKTLQIDNIIWSVELWYHDKLDEYQMNFFKLMLFLLLRLRYFSH